uniref:Replicase n=1 Tax=Xiangshan rhabdo-like virus 2 TaxID=2886225 RepID=A0A8K1YQP8_9RHAB|nr:MAG: RNA dependent RNA polymerase [Xiangshan rhabdo-like virus 2]
MTFCLDTHLNSALNNAEILSCLQEPNQCLYGKSKSLKNLRKHLTSVQVATGIKLEDCHLNPQSLLKRLMDKVTSFIPSEAIQARFCKEWESIKQLVPLSLIELESKFVNPTFIQSKLSLVKEHPYFNILLNLYDLRLFLETGVCATASITTESAERHLGNSSRWGLSDGLIPLYNGHSRFIPEVHLSKEIVLIPWTNNEIYFATRNHYLMLSDVFSQRFLCLFSCMLAEILKKDNYPSCRQLMSVFEFGDNILHQIGNEGYSAISKWEAIMVSLLLQLVEDPISHPHDFKEEIKEEFVNSCQVHNYEFLKSLYKFYIEEYFGYIDNPHIINQCHGLYRIWGHPSIDNKLGIRKLREIATHQRFVNYNIVDLITYKWREYFCTNYHRKHKRWPNMEFNEPEPYGYLIRKLRQGQEISLYHPEYHLSDWRFVKFSQTFNIPDKFELSEMIADKATSFGFEELKKNLELNGSIGPSYQRSVIVRWLNENINDPTEFLKGVDENGFSYDERVVGVHPKEREIRIAARMFGLLPLKKRLYVVITEALIAEYILPYFPEITMTFDAGSLLTKIHHNTKTLGKGITEPEEKIKEFSIIYNMDFIKWNSHMRKEETASIFSDFDNLFGLTNCFRRSHELFHPAFLYLADGSVSHELNEGKTDLKLSDYVWDDHLGGIEGLRQKGWTIFTVVILKYIVESMGLDFELMGQGDNQVLIIKFYNMSKNLIQEKSDLLLGKLQHFLSLIGPPLKLEETWSSSGFFTYGKFAVFKGTPLSMSLKKVCRTMRLTNEGLQNLESTLSSISANAAAASSSDLDPVIPFIIGKFETLAAIVLHLYRPFYGYPIDSFSSNNSFSIPGEGTRVTVPLLIPPQLMGYIKRKPLKIAILLSCVPSILGGFPSLQLPDLLCHGFPDPLTLHLAHAKKFLRKAKHHLPWLFKWLVKMLDPPISRFVNPEMICEDPVSLNLVHASSGSEKVKRLVFLFLTSQFEAQNEVFLCFLKLAKKRQTELADLLFSMSPFNPRVASSLMESTIVGRAMKIVSKVNKTGVLINLMARYHDNQISQILSLEIEEGLEYDRPARRSMSELYGIFENNYTKSILYIFSHGYSDSPEQFLKLCSVTHANRLRTTSWRKPDITGVTVAPPNEMIKIQGSNGTGCDFQSHVNIDLGYILSRSCEISSVLRSKNTPSLIIGPYKPYFGSSTKVKVSYEGSKFLNVSPPLIIQALKNLRLIGWGAERNSKLAHLLLSIFQSLTDLPYDMLIPTQDNIAGSLEHRWDDTRVDHKATPSILYNYMTHLALDTGFFSPENVQLEQTTDNVNVSFQSIFSWLGCMWSTSCVYKCFLWDPNCHHLHIGCRDCVLPINESFLELNTTKTKEEIQEMFSPIKENPYCWVSSSSIKTNVLPELEEHKIETSIDNLVNQEASLTWLAVEWFITNNKVSPYTNRVQLQDPESQSMFPLTVALYLDAPGFFDWLAVFKVLEYIFIVSRSLERKIHLDLEDWIREGVQALQNIPRAWYAPCFTFLLSNEAFSGLTLKNPDVPPPKGYPPAFDEKTNYFKELLIASSMKILNTSHLISCLDTLTKNQIPKSTLGYLSRDFIVLVKNVLISPKTYHRSLISTLRKVFMIASDDATIYNTFPLVQKWMSDPIVFTEGRYKEDISEAERGSLSCAFILIGIQEFNSNKPMYFDISMQALSSSKGFRQRPRRDGFSPLEISCISPSAFVSLKSEVTVLHAATHPWVPIHKSDIQINVECYDPGFHSLINHSLKIAGLTTTSVYKLLSLLKIVLPKSSLKFQDQVTIGCFADGEGGFSVLFKRLFPNSYIFFNSLFNLQKLSSVGINTFMPSNCLLYGSGESWVLKPGLNVEGDSDLAKESTLAQLLKLNIKCRIVSCDAEGGGIRDVSKQYSILKNLLNYCYECQSEIIIFKSYVSNLTVAWGLFQVMLGSCAEVTVLRSHFSSVGNTEVYLVGFKVIKPVNVKIEMKLGDEGKGDIVIIHNNILPYESYLKFKTSIKSNKCFLYFPIPSGVSYSQVLFDPKIENALRESFKNRLSKLISKRVVHLPSDVVLYLRRQYNLVKFTQGERSRFKQNLLTVRTLKSIVTEYLLWTSLGEESFQTIMETIETLLTSGFAHFYDTIDDSWSLSLSMMKFSRVFYSYRYDLGEIFQQNDIKRLFVEIGRLRYFSKSIIQETGVKISRVESEKFHGFPKFAFSDKHTISLIKDDLDWRIYPKYKKVFKEGKGCKEKWNWNVRSDSPVRYLSSMRRLHAILFPSRLTNLSITYKSKEVTLTEWGEQTKIVLFSAPHKFKTE